jgi:hypothetical protein
LIFWTVLSLVLAGGTPTDDLDVQASLFGYNLLWPTSRCCAFELHISPDGGGTLVTEVNTSGQPVKTSRDLHLTADQIIKIRIKLRELDFFNVPTDSGFSIIDGDQRRLTVRLGGRTHTVNIPDSAASDTPTEKRRLSELNSLWDLIVGDTGAPRP